MTEICPVCQSPKKSESAFCSKCGHNFNEKHCPKCNNIIDPDTIFCDHCGFKISDEVTTLDSENSNIPVVAEPPQVSVVKAQPQEIQPIPVHNPVQNMPYPPQPQGKRKKAPIGLFIGIGAAIIILVVGAFALKSLSKKSPKTVTPAVSAPISVEKVVAPPKYSYEVPQNIRPALYQSTDYVVYFKGSSDEDKELLLTVEVPGFTQKYEQKITLTPQELKMKIRPPMIEGVLKTLNISKEAQIKVTLQDTATQKFLIQDSKPLTLLSKYDMKWAKEDGSETYYQNICAWITPEAPIIKELLRNSINQLSAWTGGVINAVVGYQQIGDLASYDISYYQAAAIFETLRSHYKVRYNATPVSTSGSEAQQRVALPEDVIKQKSGLCIETAVTMASAIEATGMHAMILILPGHAQVALEDWANSGEYYLIETTALTEPNWDNIIIYLTKDQWNNYIEKNQVTVIDVELARKDGIKPME